MAAGRHLGKFRMAISLQRIIRTFAPFATVSLPHYEDEYSINRLIADSVLRLKSSYDASIGKRNVFVTEYNAM